MSSLTKILSLLESSFNYKVPTSVKQQMIDFYVLNYISSLDHPRLDDVVLYDVQDGYKKLVDYLAARFIEEIFFIIVTEFILVNEFEQQELFALMDRKGKGAEIREYIKHYEQLYGDELITAPAKFGEVDETDAWAYNAWKKTKLTKEEMVRLAKAAFDGVYMEEGYGGEAWSQICEAWFSLVRANSTAEKAAAIDHIYDLEHNTGSLFTKLKTYNQNGYAWISTYLDKKRDAKDPRSLLQYASPEVRGVANRVLLQTEPDDEANMEEGESELSDAVEALAVGDDDLTGEKAAEATKVIYDWLTYKYKSGGQVQKLQGTLESLGMPHDTASSLMRDWYLETGFWIPHKDEND